MFLIVLGHCAAVPTRSGAQKFVLHSNINIHREKTYTNTGLARCIRNAVKAPFNKSAGVLLLV